MKLGIALDFGSRTRTVGQQIDRYQPILRAAEEYGFTTVWAGESYPTGPADHPIFHAGSALMVLAALAGRTTLRLGTAVTLASAWHPLRLAHDAVLVDHISDGRLELGIGLGRPSIARRFGTASTGRAAHLEDCLRTLRRTWDAADNDDDDDAAWPRPVQPGGPPLLVGGGVAASARRAAELGDGYYVGSSSYEYGRIEELSRIYRDACRRFSRPQGPVHANRFTLVDQDGERAHRLGGEFIGTALDDYAAAGSLPYPQHLQAAPPDVLFRHSVASMTVVGTPDAVVEQLRRYERAGVSSVACRVSAGDTPVEVAVGTVRALGDLVAPRLLTR